MAVWPKSFWPTTSFLDRNVAVKMLRDQFLGDNELLEQFRREAKSAARLVHPYIINYFMMLCRKAATSI